MEIEVEIKHTDDEIVAIMRLKGDINASNFMVIVNKARELYNNPARSLILDLGDVTSVSTTGVVALHKIALVYSGVPQEMDTEAATKDMRPDFTHSANARKFVKLLNPQPEVDKALEKAGMKLFFKIYTDLEKALESF
jgi:anti-anti-sigma regulatory factor